MYDKMRRRRESERSERSGRSNRSRSRERRHRHERSDRNNRSRSREHHRRSQRSDRKTRSCSSERHYRSKRSDRKYRSRSRERHHRSERSNRRDHRSKEHLHRRCDARGCSERSDSDERRYQASGNRYRIPYDKDRENRDRYEVRDGYAGPGVEKLFSNGIPNQEQPSGGARGLNNVHDDSAISDREAGPHQSIKELNIVVQLQHLPKVSNPSHPRPDDFAREPKKVTVAQTIIVKHNNAEWYMSPVIRNNNPDWHSLNYGKECKICGCSTKTALVNHYVNVHLSSEVFSSRVTPKMADLLRNPNVVHKCERVISRRRNAFEQLCYFCDEVKRFRRYNWINHLIMHTGYYKYYCDECSQKFPRNNAHQCGANGSVKKLLQPQFEGSSVNAYLCDLCNFVRFVKTEIINHMRKEHDAMDMDNFKTVIFLTFPHDNPKHRPEDVDDDRIAVRPMVNEDEMVEAATVIEKASANDLLLTNIGNCTADDSWETVSD